MYVVFEVALKKTCVQFTTTFVGGDIFVCAHACRGTRCVCADEEIPVSHSIGAIAHGESLGRFDMRCWWYCRKLVRAPAARRRPGEISHPETVTTCARTCTPSSSPRPPWTAYGPARQSAKQSVSRLEAQVTFPFRCRRRLAADFEKKNLISLKKISSSSMLAAPAASAASNDKFDEFEVLHVSTWR